MSAYCLTRVLGIDGVRLFLDGQPFPFQGLSFFNAIYNPTFNAGVDQRLAWLRTFQENGINALQVWCQWDFHRPIFEHLRELAPGTCLRQCPESRCR